MSATRMTATQPPPDWVTDEAPALYRRWREHAHGIADAANTVFAVFGIASAQGRIADKVTYNNPMETMWIEDATYSRGVRVRDERDYRDECPASAAAAEIISNRLRRVPAGAGCR